MTHRRRIAAFAALLAASAGASADGYKGDLGLGVFSRQGTYKGESTQTSVLPFVWGQWGRFFGRVDTFGVEVLPFGYGHLEIGTRVLLDGMDSETLKNAGVRERRHSRPFGFSSFQRTPLGAVSLALMRDLGDSKGWIADASWIGRIEAAPWLKIYPEVGLEMLSEKYTAYYFGTYEGEGGFAAHTPGRAFNPYVAIHTSSPLSGHWNLAFTLRNKALDEGIGKSPLAARTGRWNAYVAVSYEFK